MIDLVNKNNQSMNTEGKPIILKASYNEIKIKFQVADDS